MSNYKHVTFTSDHVSIFREKPDFQINHYAYINITTASKSRLENLQFTALEKPVVLFTLDYKDIFSSFTYSQ